jgi:hypothetical protein
VLDPTVGYTTDGSSIWGNGNYIICLAIAGVNGTVTKITARNRPWSKTAATVKCKCAVYNGNNIITNGGSNERSNDATSYAWLDYTFASNPEMTTAATMLALWANRVDVGGVWCEYETKYDTGSSGDGYFQSLSYGAWPVLSLTTSDYKFSIYATYTPKPASFMPFFI